ncbi:MAG: class I SAM-dependent methyltransferase, partial [Rhodothermales bacterium]|nr:class I SAM-dependent methyltransferase [Rhodothermales bacterium]
DRLGAIFNRRPILQRVFFSILNLVFLRSWYVRRELRRRFSSIDSSQAIRVLDAGTGFGQYTYWILSHFPRANVVAVDIKEDYLEQARKLTDARGYGDRVRYVIDDLTQLETSGPFDFILSVDVMEHIEDDRGVLRNFEKVLAPGGGVLINTPSDLGGSDIQTEGDESFISEHVRDGYNKDELEEKLSTAGLTPVRTVYTYGRAGNLAWRLLIKYPMKMLGTWWGFLVILPVYYLLVLPVGLLLNAADLNIANERGTGILAFAQKP